MKIASRAIFQGDVFFVRVDKLPEGAAKRLGPEAHVAAHSETQHHHTADSATIYEIGDPMVSYLSLEGVEFADVVHHRPFDTHETVRLLGGTGAVWQIRRQREGTPEGWRRVED